MTDETHAAVDSTAAGGQYGGMTNEPTVRLEPGAGTAPAPTVRLEPGAGTAPEPAPVKLEVDDQGRLAIRATRGIQPLWRWHQYARGHVAVLVNAIDAGYIEDIRYFAEHGTLPETPVQPSLRVGGVKPAARVHGTLPETPVQPSGDGDTK